MQTSKKELRAKFLRERKKLSREDVEKFSNMAAQKLLEVLPESFKSIMFYVPINNEIDLLRVAMKMIQLGKIVLFPRLRNYEDIVPCVVRDMFNDFVRGAYNIPEPNTPSYSGAIDVIIAPGIVFDKEGYRLGYGKGYFDKFLSAGRYGTTIGVCYDSLLVDSLPHDALDIPVETIVTPETILRIK